MSDLKAQFEAAAQAAQNLSSRPSTVDLLRLYALYKQATVGDVQGKRPGFTDPKGQAKYDAWQKVKGLKPEQAMQQYIDLVKKLGG